MQRIAQVAGAGVAGLTLATALGRRGWRVIVHERSARLREIGAGITLGPTGIEVLTRVGALDDAIADAARVGYWSMYDERGWTVQSQRVRRDMYCCHRRSLHRSLANSARAAGVEIRTSSPVTGATGDALVFGGRDPEVLEGDLVVGADGVDSVVRRSLDGNGLDVTCLDLNASSLRYVLPRRSGEWISDQPEWLRDSRRVGILPLGDAMAVFLSCRRDDKRARTDPLDHDHWISVFPEARDVIERAPEKVLWHNLKEVRCSRWSVGRTALLGDAAFAMASNLGQGAVSAMSAALALADEVTDSDDVQAALARWEARERPGIEYNQVWSRRYNSMATAWPKWLYPVRSATYWVLGKSDELKVRFGGA
ncbi:NAD(P)/FAD-dependent oxidoreductase [Amycolatopsis sp. EV170708-02-1]|uniref:FAD-dependent oxidoreductase n=1 Tax=Amycolatopsis sp. EV170708-02-1 TaxID=2919322 RepID=UPI001F0BBDF2|nr:NAD(P)/FAD-dependent oxidoreductase [Amycolatopsis sp. EV170708-02-1]UMP06920.1 FAD-dependent monooxygenase [Amycolatopsis sp. EV170708-02-1]